MIEAKYSIAIAEFLHILKGFSNEDVNKIPKKVLNYFEENCNKDYICDFDYNDNIDNMNLKKETYGLLGLICYNYWCETEEEKKNYYRILQENEKKYQEDLSKKFDINNIFENKNHKFVPTNEIEQKLIVRHNGKLKRTINYFKEIFNRKRKI